MNTATQDNTVSQLLFQNFVYLSAVRLFSIFLYILSALLQVLLNRRSKMAILSIKEGGVSHETQLQTDCEACEKVCRDVSEERCKQHDMRSDLSAGCSEGSSALQAAA